MNTSASCVCLVLICALSGCDDGEAQSGRYVVTAVGGLPASNDAQGRAVCSNFSSRLLVKDRMNQAVTIFNPNETIGFEILVTNNSSSPQTISASASCSAATFEVVSPSGEKLWNNLVMCVRAEPPRTYAPFETVSYEALWGQQTRMSLNPPAAPLSELVECRTALSKSQEFQIL